eukprot:8696537-Pyramimonas_sp.AAC.1
MHHSILFAPVDMPSLSFSARKSRWRCAAFVFELGRSCRLSRLISGICVQVAGAVVNLVIHGAHGCT